MLGLALPCTGQETTPSGSKPSARAEAHLVNAQSALIQGKLGEEPKGWQVPTAGFSAHLVPINAQTAGRAALLQKEKGAKQTAPFGNLMRAFSAAPYHGKKLRFRATVRFERTLGTQPNALQPDEAHLWMRVDRANNAGMSFFDNMENRPITSPERKPYEIVGPISDDAETVLIGLLLIGEGRAWMDSATVEVWENERWTPIPEGKLVLDPTPASKALDPKLEQTLVAQLKERALPIKTVEAGHGFEDLAALDQIVGDARLVGLGEASHGTREFFQMKHRILEYLVEKKGFTVFAIEANWPEVEVADRYIKTGKGDVTGALDAMYFWTWHTHEVADLIQWMHDYNQKPGQHPILTFTGFDMQTPDVAAQQVLDYFGKADKPSQESAAKAYARFHFDHLAERRNSTPEAKAADLTHAEEVLKLLDSRRDVLVKASSEADYRHARQCAHIVAQAAKMNAPEQNQFGVRDQSMAENVRWLAEEAYPKQKMVLWAHNGHIGDTMIMGAPNMGRHLRQMFGKELVTFGFGFDFGEIRALTIANGKMTTGPVALKVPHAMPGSAEALLRQAGSPRYLLDMRAIPPTSPLGTWLAADQLFREPGAAFAPSEPNSMFSPVSLSKTFDNLIFISESHASVLLPSGRPPK